MPAVAGEDNTIEDRPVLVKEFHSKIYQLIPSLSKNDRLEASGIQLFQDYYYIVFDNFSAVAKLHISLDRHHPGNEMISGAKPMEQFEGITYSPVTRRFYIVIENIEVEEAGLEKTAASGVANTPPKALPYYKPKICEYDEHFNFLEAHPVEHVFPVQNKGLEGLAVVRRHGNEYVLGLCESAGNDDGNQAENGMGTLLVLKKNSDRWLVERTISLPQSVQFGDYASVDIHDNDIAVVSQVSSTLWVGRFKEDSWSFPDEGKIYRFPRSKKNKVKYCNVEGVTWISSDKIAVVSDKRKSIDAGRCKKKDQSIHIFKIPK